jgi:hypothetical protein
LRLRFDELDDKEEGGGVFPISLFVGMELEPWSFDLSRDPGECGNWKPDMIIPTPHVDTNNPIDANSNDPYDSVADRPH